MTICAPIKSTRIIVAAVMLCLFMGQAVAQDRPSWRAEQDTPKLRTLPPDIQGPQIEFKVDRSALLANSGLGFAAMSKPRPEGDDQPEQLEADEPAEGEPVLIAREAPEDPDKD